MTGWPRYLGPGWLAAYALGLLCWLAIARLWGAVVVVALIAIGLFGTLAIAEWLHETNRPRPPATLEDHR